MGEEELNLTNAVGYSIQFQFQLQSEFEFVRSLIFFIPLIKPNYAQLKKSKLPTQIRHLVDNNVRKYCCMRTLSLGPRK